METLLIDNDSQIILHCQVSHLDWTQFFESDEKRRHSAVFGTDSRQNNVISNTEYGLVPAHGANPGFEEPSVFVAAQLSFVFLHLQRQEKKNHICHWAQLKLGENTAKSFPSCKFKWFSNQWTFVWDLFTKTPSVWRRQPKQSTKQPRQLMKSQKMKFWWSSAFLFLRKVNCFLRTHFWQIATSTQCTATTLQYTNCKKKFPSRTT